MIPIEPDGTDHHLLEPSWAEAIQLIDASGLPAEKRSHWICSLRQIAKTLDRPLETIPARWTNVHLPLSRLHPARVGLTAKTLANHRANVKAALRWLAGEQDLPTRGAPLLPVWAALRDAISDKGVRARLYGLMRYASAQKLGPDQVGDTLIAAYLSYRATATDLASGVVAHRSIARSWNGCVDEVPGWPDHRLSEPALSFGPAGPAWEELPEGLRRDLEAYFGLLVKPRRNARGKRLQPVKDSTLRTRRAELLAFIRKAASLGLPVSQFTSLGELLAPEVVEAVLDAYWQDSGDEPATYTIDLAWKLHGIARDTGCLDEAALEKLDDLQAELGRYRRSGLTDKNMALVRQVLSGSVWQEVVALSACLMAEARDLQAYAPVKAALRAQLAVAIALLTVAPVRLGNLVRIELEENLIRPAGPASPHWLVFPDYDVKNRIQLQFPLDAGVSALIDEYVHQHRPVLLRGSNATWLFPGESGGYKTPSMFSGQITAAVAKAVGIRLTAHQFRHAAAAIILRHDPGNYEWARRVLGHKNIQTTICFYIGLESTEATRRFGEIVRPHVAAQVEERP